MIKQNLSLLFSFIAFSTSAAEPKFVTHKLPFFDGQLIDYQMSWVTLNEKTEKNIVSTQNRRGLLDGNQWIPMVRGHNLNIWVDHNKIKVSSSNVNQKRNTSVKHSYEETYGSPASVKKLKHLTRNLVIASVIKVPVSISMQNNRWLWLEPTTMPEQFPIQVKFCGQIGALCNQADNLPLYRVGIDEVYGLRYPHYDLYFYSRKACDTFVEKIAKARERCLNEKRPMSFVVPDASGEEEITVVED